MPQRQHNPFQYSGDASAILSDFAQLLVVLERAVEAERRRLVVYIRREVCEGVGDVGLAGPRGDIDGGLVAQNVDLLAGEDPVHLVDTCKVR